MLKRCDDDGPYWSDRAPRRAGIFERATHLIRRALTTLGIWIDRSKRRRQLAQMSERQIKDLGVTRCDALREMNKRFWEA